MLVVWQRDASSQSKNETKREWRDEGKKGNKQGKVEERSEIERKTHPTHTEANRQRRKIVE